MSTSPRVTPFAAAVTPGQPYCRRIAAEEPAFINSHLLDGFDQHGDHGL